MRAVSVPGPQAESLRLELHRLRLVDGSVRIEKRGDRVLIPLSGAPSVDLGKWGADLVELSSPVPRPRVRNPAEELAQRLRAAGVPQADIPRRWEKIGDVVVLRLPSSAEPHKAEIAEAVAAVLRAQAVVEDVSGIHGRMRTPELRILWGTDTETVHLEGDVRYALDVSKVMFSSGNLAERIAVAELARPGDVVVDLFAGIGYFTLPIAVHARAATIYACEMNPVAFEYLHENVRLNRVANVIPLLGDCRTVAPAGVADLVLMGHFDAGAYLDVAFRCLKGAGTLLYHELVPKERFPEDPVRHVSDAARGSWCEVVGTRSRIVKSYAPGIVHAVVEARVRRQANGPMTSGPG